MKKKEYKVPAIKVANLDCSDILCGSGGGNYNENLRNGTIDEALDLEQDEHGYVWADAKGEGAIGDAW